MSAESNTRQTAGGPAPKKSEPPAVSADVVVIGGGLVGGSLALALAEGGLSVIMIEARDPAEGLDAGFDGRASAMSLASKRLLDGIGAWSMLEADAQPILDIRVADGASPLFLDYHHDDVGDEPFGWMLENRHLRRALFHAVRSAPRIDVVAPARVVSLERDGARARAVLDDGRQLIAPLAVGADGRGSWVRRTAGIETTSWSYHQVGIVVTVEHERPHGGIAHEHFLPAGPFAILPLTGPAGRPGTYSSLVWTEAADLAPALLALDAEDFMVELERRFGDFMGPLSVVGPRWSYPLGLQFAAHSTDERLVLVGDADHAMHPIAGQGLNMGLRDVAALAEVLGDARKLGLDIGGDQVLGRYRRWRGFDNSLMLAATDGLNRLFSNDIQPLRLARSAGLAAVDRIVPLKRLLMRHAMGTLGELPRLMRG